LSQNRILVIEPDSVIRSGITNFLTTRGHIVSEAVNCHDGQLQLNRFRPDAAVLDCSLPNGDASHLLQQMKTADPAVPVLVLVSQASLATGGGAIRQAAEQFLVKPVELSVLHSMLLRMLRAGKNSQALLAPAKTRREHINPFVGLSPAIRRLREIASRVLSSESPILLQGETGAGKGVLANWIHRNGPRSQQPFLDLNCAGLSRELLESELFGHEKGAFTSAVNAKPGLLEVANHGTVFLDEIGDIDLQVQPKLLKVLEDRVFRRLGEVRDRSVDVRLISATHRELLELVRQQRFRSDLYFRLNIVYIQVPPLRERAEDIPPLARQLLCNLTQNCGRNGMTIADSAMLTLQRYPWPGNIRELRNVLERAVLMAEGNLVSLQHMQFQGPSLHEPVRLIGPTGTLKQVERAYINHVLHDEAGSIERAARRLGIPRSSLYNKMKRFEIPHGTGRL
jgi:DNA-binding NtrC family response regulator